MSSRLRAATTARSLRTLALVATASAAAVAVPGASANVQLPEPDAGALYAPVGSEPGTGSVMGARAEERLVATATFQKKSISVGGSTTLSVKVTNEGNVASTPGRVCVRLSSQLVVTKLPKGVTNNGSAICAGRTAISSSDSQTAIRGVVVRGVSASQNAGATDGVNDGVILQGSRLAVQQGSGNVRAGGVTG